MARTPQVLFSHSLYELVPRAEQGLPFPPTATSKVVIEGVLARTQRDFKVELHNYAWMNSHGHILPSSYEDPSTMAAFSCEFKTKCTQALKALTGKGRLRLWERHKPPILLCDKEAAITRVVYMFLNPVEAGLADSIDEYCGLSTWHEFISCPPDVSATVTKEVMWYPTEALPLLPKGRSLTPAQDQAMVRQMEASGLGEPHTLTITPLGWLKPFGITDPEEIEKIRHTVIRRVREREAELRHERQKNHQRVMPVSRLVRQPYLAPHTPCPRERNIFLICSDPLERVQRLRHYTAVGKESQDATRRAKKGEKNVSWPKGVFIPWLPPTCGCPWVNSHT